LKSNMEELRKLQEALGFERHPGNIESWRKERHSESPWYSERERAYYDRTLPKTTAPKRTDLIEHIIQFKICLDKYRVRVSVTKPGITGRFVFRGSKRVLSFLGRNPYLVPLLTEAGKEINKYFPEPELFLEIVSDPDGVDPDQLFLYISTDLPPSEARPKLKALDREWWLSALDKAQGKLCISLEYQ